MKYVQYSSLYSYRNYVDTLMHKAQNRFPRKKRGMLISSNSILLCHSWIKHIAHRLFVVDMAHKDNCVNSYSRQRGIFKQIQWF